MALSGSFYTSTYTGISSTRPRRIYVSWSATQSVADNTSTIKWTVKAEGSSGTDWVNVGPVRLYINGTRVLNRTDRFRLHKGDSIGSGSITVTHNSDGTKSCSVKAEAAIYSSSVNSTYSGTITLNTIARASSITSISPSSVAMNQSISIQWKPASTSFTYKIRLDCNGYVYQTTSALKCQNQTFISPDGSSNASTQWNSPNLTFKISSVEKYLGNSIPNATSASVKCTLYTYSNSSATTLVGSATKNFTITIPTSWVPTLNTFTATLDNSANSVINGWGIAVVGFSKVKFSGTASGTHNSTIKSFTLSGGVSATVNGTSLSYTASLNSAGTKSFSCVATDSRGRKSSSKSASSITVYDYYNPTISSFNVERSSSNATQMVATINYDYAPVNNRNSANAVLYYRQSNTTNWTQYGTIRMNQANTLSGFEETKSYDFRVVVTDTIGNSAEATAFTSTVEVLMHWKAGGRGVAFGKICEQDGFEVAMDSRFKNPVTIDPDVMSSTPSLQVIGDIKYNTFSGNLVAKNGILQVPDSEQKVLYVCDSGIYLNGSQTCQLPESILDQPTGIVLVWSGYIPGEGEQDYWWTSTFIPKQFIAHNPGNGGLAFHMFSDLGSWFAMKYVYIRGSNQDQVVGNDHNQQTGTSNCGLKYDNRRFCLRYIVGV